MTREVLLERYGSFYGEEHLAITFTAALEGLDAKRVVSKGWDKTRPLADAGFGAGYLSKRGRNANPAVVLRPSDLIVLECDSEPDLVAVTELGLPATVTVRSSADYKRHWWFRPPAELEALPYVAFRFESGRITADSGRYFLVPPSIHPSGAVYSFLPGLGPEEVDIAELPETVYRSLVGASQRDDDQLRERIEFDPEAKIQAGKRREMIFRYACMLRRWGQPYDEILRSCEEFNRIRCHPPVEHHLVRIQVDGAMKKRGDQELEQALAAEPEFSLTPISAAELCEEPDLTLGQQLGPLVVAAARTIIVGDTGEGKTTIAFQIVRSILRGSEFLDWHGVGEGRALVIDLEQGRRSVKRSLRDAGLADSVDVDLVLVPDGLSLDKEQLHYDELERVIGEGGYSIVLLDPYYKAHRADEPNAERPIVDLMRKLDTLRTSYGFALILPAHPRKTLAGSSTIRTLTIHDVAGSSAVTRGAEIVLGIERVAHGRARLRFLKEREGDLPVGQAWRLTFSKEHGFQRDPADLDNTDYPQKVREAMDDGGWYTKKDVKEAVEIGIDRAEALLKTLLADGELEYQESPPGRRKGAKCYRLLSVLGNSGHQETLGTLTNDEERTVLVSQHVVRDTRRQDTYEYELDETAKCPETAKPQDTSVDDDIPLD